MVLGVLLLVVSAWVMPALAEAGGRGHGGGGHVGRGHGGGQRSFGGHWQRFQGHGHGGGHRWSGGHGHTWRGHGHWNGAKHWYGGYYAYPLAGFWPWWNYSYYPAYVAPTVEYVSVPATYGYEAPVVQQDLTVAPATGPAEVVHPHGRYVLTGDGVNTPYRWLWIPNPPSAPPADSSAPPRTP
jgi:hypothetical protein